jgi:hypothetical protein
MKLRTLAAVAVLAGLGTGCGPDEKPYQPKEAYTGKKPTLPQVPTLPNKAKKEGDAYTVWGAMHDLHSVVHEKDFEGKDTTLVGYVVKTNWDTLCADENKPGEDEHCVPKCAIHKTGKADPADCEPPVPTFWIAETKEEQNLKKMIPVMGFASNFAQMFTYIEGLDKDDEATLEDEFWGHELPRPLPAVGGKVKVTGKYGTVFEKGSGPTASNPKTGILTWNKQEWLEPPPKRAVLPGMRVRKTEN